MNYIEKVNPAFENCNKCIVLAADNNYIPYASVMIQSIVENAQRQNNYDIIILHKNITMLNQQIIRGMAGESENISIRFCNVGNVVKDNSFYIQNRANFTEEAYYRLLIPWVVSEKYQWALYLDGDMIVTSDLYEIFDFAPTENLISAVRDYWGICACYNPQKPMREYRESIGLTDIDNYIISATIIFNLTLFRKQFQVDNILKFAASKNWKQHDQDVLNLLCYKNIKFLSPTWGLMSDYGENHFLPSSLRKELESAGDLPKIIHYGGVRKPWKYAYVERDMFFWRCAQNTPFFAFLLEQVKSLEYRNYVAYELFTGYDGKYKYDYYCGPDSIQQKYRGVSLGNLSSGHTKYRVIEVKNNVLHIEGLVGFFSVPPSSKIEVFLEVNGELFPATVQLREDGYIPSKKITTYRGESFKFDLPLQNNSLGYTIKIVCEIDGIVVEKCNLGFEKFSPLTKKYKDNYYYSENWAVQTDGKALTVFPCDKKKCKALEKTFCKELRKSGRRSDKKAILARRISMIVKKLFKKPILLISDRISRAGDNGEAFFKFLNREAKGSVSSYFIIGKNTEDYNRIRQYGKVIPAYSWRHKIFQLMADFVVSSQTDDVFRNPFQSFSGPYVDLLNKAQYVFLQHGVIANDLTLWLKRSRQHMAGFVTSALRERQFILSGDYDYCEKEIWLTGLPRFDFLEDKPERIITIMPTWRKELAIGQDHSTGVWQLKEHFAESAYVTFYREVMNSRRLQEKAAELGYRVQFKIHPSFQNQESSFGFEPYVNVIDAVTSYQEIYAKSCLVITDYSSAVFDFAYLRKPIIYCQFDADEFFGGNHIVSGRGYFDYARDGFGEVEYDLESTVDRIIEYMENDCKLKDKYRERIDKFFAFNDQNNCQRVYEKIMELDKRD